MSTAIIENFSRGLDTRRSELTSALGVLSELINAHINQGGEIEKRKSFVATDITPSAESGVTETFGCEALRDVIAIFGGTFNADPVWPPDGFTYIRLYRPATAYSAEVNAVDVIYSTTFNNKTFAVAEMADEVINCFYDGVLVKDINFYGLILPDMDSLLKLANQMLAAVGELEGFSAVLNGTNDGIIITGPEGKKFDVVASGVGDAFEATDFVITKVSNPTPGIPGTRAIATFSITDMITGQPTVHKITSILVNGVTELLNGGTAIGCQQSPAYSAGLVAASINLAAVGYTAENIDGTVIITADAADDNVNAYPLTITTVGKVLIGHCSIVFAGSDFTVDSIKADGTELLGAGTYQVNASNTLVQLTTALQDTINANTSAGLNHGFIAIARGDRLNIGKRQVVSLPQEPSSQASDSSVKIVVNITSTVGGDAASGSNAIVVTWDVAEAEVFSAPRKTGKTAVPIKFRITGGKPPYFFSYQIDNADGMEFVVISPDQQVTHLQQTSELFSYSIKREAGNYVPFDIRFVNPNNKPTITVGVTDSQGFTGSSAALPIKFTLSSAAYIDSI